MAVAASSHGQRLPSALSKPGTAGSGVLPQLYAVPPTRQGTRLAREITSKVHGLEKFYMRSPRPSQPVDAVVELPPLDHQPGRIMSSITNRANHRAQACLGMIEEKATQNTYNPSVPAMTLHPQNVTKSYDTIVQAIDFALAGGGNTVRELRHGDSINQQVPPKTACRFKVRLPAHPAQVAITVNVMSGRAPNLYGSTVKERPSANNYQIRATGGRPLLHEHTPKKDANQDMVYDLHVTLESEELCSIVLKVTCTRAHSQRNRSSTRDEKFSIPGLSEGGNWSSRIKELQKSPLMRERFEEQIKELQAKKDSKKRSVYGKTDFVALNRKLVHVQDLINSGQALPALDTLPELAWSRLQLAPSSSSASACAADVAMSPILLDTGPAESLRLLREVVAERHLRSCDLFREITWNRPAAKRNAPATAEEFRAALRRQQISLSDADFVKLVKHLDGNGDGFIDVKELDQALKTAFPQEEDTRVPVNQVMALSLLRKYANDDLLGSNDLFRELDSRGKAAIHGSKLRSALESHDIVLTDEDFTAFVKYLGMDGNGMLTMTELDQTMRAWRAHIRSGREEVPEGVADEGAPRVAPERSAESVVAAVPDVVPSPPQAFLVAIPSEAVPDPVFATQPEEEAAQTLTRVATPERPLPAVASDGEGENHHDP